MGIKYLLYMIIAVLAVSPCLHAQESEAIAERLDRQRYEFPQEKMHVMTDRGCYLAGDTIRLRAWVVDAMSHQPVSASKFVYVELLSPLGGVASRVKIHQNDNGVFEGYVALPVDMPEGRYQLTACTMFMQSVGNDYYCRVPVDVTALGSLRSRIVSRCVRFGDEVDVTLSFENLQGGLTSFKTFEYMGTDGFWNHRGAHDGLVHFTLKGDDALMPTLLVRFDAYGKYIPLPEVSAVTVNFYPEGGYLVPDVENAVAFKMHGPGNQVGREAGELLDAGGNVIASLQVEHDGMGVVHFTPRAGVEYQARWHDVNDEFLSFPLPQVRPDATVVQVRHNGTQLSVGAAGARSASAHLLVHQRGLLLAASRDSVVLDDAEFSPGVVQALLLDDDWRCLSERLFFVGQGNIPDVPVAADRDACDDRDKVKVTVDMSDMSPVMAGHDCAVVVVDEGTTTLGQGNVCANLLLQSELRGNIHAPQYYFERGDSVTAAQRMRHLDMLMLTQGWRRYDIPRLLAGHLAVPQYPIEVSQVVTGRVLSDFRKKAVADAKVSLISPSYKFSTMATTDSLGRFSIAVPLMRDSANCILVAENTKGQKQVNLEVDPDVFPLCYYLIDSSGENADELASLQSDQSWRLAQEGDWRHVILDELIVKAAPHRYNQIGGGAIMWTAEDLAQRGINSLDALVNALPGLTMVGGHLRGASGQGRVGISIDGEDVKNLYSTDLESINKLPDMRVMNRKRDTRTDRLNAALFDSGTDYELSEISIASSMISIDDIGSVSYVHGSNGGKLSFRRKSRSKGVFKEPSQYLKIAHPIGAQRPVEFYSPRYDDSDCGIEPGSDLRAVLYWNPSVKVEQGGKAVFDFYANDAHGTSYTILVESVAPDGTLIHSTHKLTKR